MSEHGQRHQNYSEFDNMSTQALEEILRLDSLNENTTESDIEAILYITEVLAKRKKADLTANLTDVDTAWASFKTNYYQNCGDGKSLYEDELPEPKRTRSIPFKQNKRKRKVRAAIITAALISMLLVGTVTAYAQGYNIWGAIAQWTSDTFGFVFGNEEVTDQNGDSCQLEDNCNELVEVLSYYGVETTLVPNWIPEEFTLEDVAALESPKKITFTAKYSNDDNVIIIEISKIVEGSAGTYEKDQLDATIFEKNDIQHYIMENNGKLVAIWKTENFECSISGDIGEQELEKMIESIYER